MQHGLDSGEDIGGPSSKAVAGVAKRFEMADI